MQDLINLFKARVGKELAEWEAKQYIRKSNKIYVKVCTPRIGLAVDKTPPFPPQVSVGGGSFVHLFIRRGATGKNELRGKQLNKKAEDRLTEFQ